MRQQYEYEFERVKILKGFILTRFTDAYKPVIERRAQEGWRLVQIFAPSVGPYGSTPFAELVFERPYGGV